MDSIEDNEKLRILLVDDERNILSSLRRLFRPCGYQTQIANSGKEALEIMADNHFDMVISDMRMPEMTGAELLEQVAIKYPDTIRILLTGYADVESTIHAINKGKIYKYVSKPWEDNDLKDTVAKALEASRIKKELERLQELTQQQNLELKDLNNSLEQKVAERTKDLNDAMTQLESANADLKSSYMASIKTFSGIIEMRKGMGSGESSKVADLARRLALACGLTKTRAQHIMVAGLLHNIGKLSLPDHLLSKPFFTLSDDEKIQVKKHPILGESLLMGLEALSESAKIIRSQHELYNGQGYPDGLEKNEISVSASILNLANEFLELKNGRLYKERYTDSQAIDFVKSNSGKRYHPKIVEKFLQMFGVEEKKSVYIREREMRVSGLRVGMKLSRDLIANNNMPLLVKGTKLNERLINKLFDYQNSIGDRLVIHVEVKISE